jgi:hypothetical protein
MFAPKKALPSGTNMSAKCQYETTCTVAKSRYSIASSVRYRAENCEAANERESAQRHDSSMSDR